MTHDEIIKLSPAERLKLIEELWDSLSDDEAPITSAQRAELVRRAATADADADEAEAVSWEALKEEIRARKG